MVTWKERVASRTGVFLYSPDNLLYVATDITLSVSEDRVQEWPGRHRMGLESVLQFS
jgi:hypothetical protein